MRAVTVEEYLNTSFDDGDREYVDDVIVPRNLGEKAHSRLLRELIAFFAGQESSLQTYCFPAQRVQVRETRFRVPDVCVYIGSEPEGEVFRTPPFLVVEILSKDDRGICRKESMTTWLSAWPSSGSSIPAGAPESCTPPPEVGKRGTACYAPAVRTSTYLSMNSGSTAAHTGKNVRATPEPVWPGVRCRRR